MMAIVGEVESAQELVWRRERGSERTNGESLNVDGKNQINYSQ